MQSDQTSAEMLRRLDALLVELLDLDVTARQIRLAELPAAEQVRLTGLLDAALVDDGFLVPGGALNPRLVDAVLGDDDALPAGTRLGPWRVLRGIGAGGMGRVFLAERADGLFQREVAIKCLEHDVLRADPQRLQREQRLLATLIHPNIAPLYDAGIDPAGTPYLVMEYVDGEAIDVWCSQQALDARQRLALVIDVCHALEAAHRKLIVHRDIKPSNILVDRAGVVKLLDFGIASLSTDQNDDSPEVATASAGRASENSYGHTPRYASPEQRAGEDIGTASDIYQLGLLALELLSGQRPAANPESGQNQPDLRSLPALGLPADDLRAVLARALADDPTARYASVDRFRDDLQRLLSSRPVEARRAGTLHRIRLLLRRHPWSSATTILGALLVVGLVTAFTVRLAEERDATRLEAQRALQSEAEAEQVVVFLRQLFRAANPYLPDAGKPASDMTALELLARARDDLETHAPESPVVRARLFSEVGRLYRLLGKAKDAELLIRTAVALLEDASDANPLELTDARLDLARTLAFSGTTDEAIALAGDAETRYRQADDRRRLAGALEVKGNLLATNDGAAAITALQESVVIYHDLQIPEREASVRLFLANSLAKEGQIEEAGVQRERALALNESRYGAEHPMVATALVGLADQYQREGQKADAVPLLERAIAIFEAQFGTDDLRTAVAHNNLGNALSDLGKPEAAREHQLRALEAYRQLAPEHEAIGTILNNLGSIAWQLGDPETAADYYRQGLERLRPRLGENHLMIGMLEANLGEALFALNDDVEARDQLELSLTHMRSRLGEHHPYLLQSLGYLTQLDEREGDFASALTRLRLALTIQEQAASGDAKALAAARDAITAFRVRHPGVDTADRLQ